MKSNDNEIPARPGNKEVEEIVIAILDIEEHCNKTKGGKPPKAKKYTIRIDRTKYTVDVPSMTGEGILALAGKTPASKFLLNQRKHGGVVVPIQPQEVVDFTAPGVERFFTLPKDQTEGTVAEVVRRRQFKLPEDDTVGLNIEGHDWETVSGNWVLVHGFPAPDGYNVREVSVAIQIPPGYPSAQLDMAYFYPPLSLTSGRAIPAITMQAIDGKAWQRWSRHYTGQNPWIVGEYNVLTHLQLVRTWMERELTRS